MGSFWGDFRLVIREGKDKKGEIMVSSSFVWKIEKPKVTLTFSPYSFPSLPFPSPLDSQNTLIKI